MKCTVPGANMKVLARAIQALGRIGDELYVEPNVDSLSFRSVNASRSAYASFTFHRPFFAFYKYVPSEESQSSQLSSRCKISIKSCMPVFRSPVMLDRKVENCIMRFDENGSKLVFEMKCRYGISKTYYLPIIECGILQVVYTKTPEMNTLNAPAQVFTDIVHNFLNTQEEITLDVTPEKTFIRSYIDDSLKGSKIKSTEISLNVSEFNQYVVHSPNTVTFSLKEFRALLSFAEATNLDIEACFGVRGKPINFTVKYEKTYEADFILSTLSPEVDAETPTPQQLRVPNSNSVPVISDGSSAVKQKVLPTNCHPSTSLAARANLTPSSCGPTSNLIPDLNLNSSQQPQPRSIERGESPGLASGSQRQNSSSHSLPNSSRNTPVNRSQQQFCVPSTRMKSPSMLSTKRGRSSTSVSSRNAIPNSMPEFHVNQSPQQLSSSIMTMDSPDLTAKNGLNSMSLEIDLSDDFDMNSPQHILKRRRLQLFNYTLDANSIPGHDIILVNDSDDESTNN